MILTTVEEAGPYCDCSWTCEEKYIAVNLHVARVEVRIVEVVPRLPSITSSHVAAMSYHDTMAVNSTTKIRKMRFLTFWYLIV